MGIAATSTHFYSGVGIAATSTCFSGGVACHTTIKKYQRHHIGGVAASYSSSH
jgi:hypothetical protein